MAPASDKQPIWRRFLILPPIIVGVLVLAFVITGKSPPATNPIQETARHVRVITAAPTLLVPRVTGFGAVAPAKVWHAVAQVSGKITYVHPRLRKGAILDKDTEIIRIDPSDYDFAIAEAQANIRSAKAKLTEQKVTETNLNSLLAIEQRSLKLKKTQLERKRNLKQRGTISQASLDDEQRLTLTQEKVVQDLENNLRLLPTQIAVQREQIAVNQSKLATALLNRARTSIRLPFTGRIAEMSAEETQFAQAGAELAVADDIKTSEIEAQFPISQLAPFGAAFGSAAARPAFTRVDLAKLARVTGLHSIIRLSAGDRQIEWRGRIVRASDTIDPQTRTVGVISAVDDSYKIAVPGKRPPLTKGLFVEVELRVNPLKDRIVIPRAALSGNRVYVVNEENRLEVRIITPGMTLGGLVDATNGLKAGDRVVVSDISPAIPGLLIKAVEDKDLADRLKRIAQATE